MKKAVVFDLDGTLLDTLEDLYLSVNYALEKLSYPLRTREEIRAFVGNGVANLILRALPENAPDFEECLKIFKEHYSLHSEDHTAPYNKVIEMLDALNEKNIPCAVVSNKFDGAVKRLCEKYFGSRITFALGERPDFARKPAPDGVFIALDELKVKKEDALYVGDSEVDVLTAKNANIDCVCVLWGFRDKEELVRAGGTTFAETVEELTKIITE
ncbi:MAG: HAD family hydrolase [Clostridia bacterium]|nr:HAD family hydrolase [Clostridia bacterium]